LKKQGRVIKEKFVESRLKEICHNAQGEREIVGDYKEREKVKSQWSHSSSKTI